MFNNELKFQSDPKIGFEFIHEFPRINKKKTYGFQLYVTNNDAVSIAKLYKDNIVRKGEFKTLQEKARKIKKLKNFMVRLILFWNQNGLSDSNINWPKLREQINSPVFSHIKALIQKNSSEPGAECI